MIGFEYKKIGLFIAAIFVFGIYSITAQIVTGAEQIKNYLPALKGKRVGLVVNQTSVINNVHLVDTLKKLNIKITTIFAPEHGFRGDHSAGAKIKSTIDEKTGLTVVSLYGKNYKPSADMMKKVDVIIFDIQDVGARFYTYISTLHYVMEACAENKKLLIVLDRPNPNGYYVDGPVLDMKFKSFVGMHPVPVVHGMTVGEYATMINGEKWLKDSLKCKLQVVKMKDWNHAIKYILPIKPSPNLPTPESITLYPSVCFFEGINYSLGRGTDKPFECIGKPGNTQGDYVFTPKNIKGVADNPPFMNKQCRGFLLTDYAKNIFPLNPSLNISWIIEMYQNDSTKDKFFNNFFNKLAGNDILIEQIKTGVSEEEIKASWQNDLMKFKKTRKKYMLYPDFDSIINRN
ncbi:MAG: DUF1343 domain-containing protein [Bacteroidia bacterium]|nr:DUF1343 domain-containing protein [Bacteroidia bacterium]MBP9688447.1 DUF1343 domain-containing protein [Bacteroidia bacterium]